MRSLGVFEQLATTVSQCHVHGLAHGQLRPEHVLLGADGQTVKLLGFDPIAWRQIRHGPSLGERHALRPPGPHDAPELRGETHAPLATLLSADVWSLGVLFCAILVEAPPTYVASERSVRLPAAISCAPASTRRLLELMLSPRPSDRPSSAEVKAHAHDLLHSLSLHAFGEPAATPPQPPMPMHDAPLPTTSALADLEHDQSWLPSADVAEMADLPSEAMLSVRLHRSASTVSTATVSLDALPDTLPGSLSEAPTRASSLLTLEEPASKHDALATCEHLYEKLRLLEARQVLPSLER